MSFRISERLQSGPRRAVHSIARRRGLVLVRMRDHDRRVDIDGNQLAVRARGGITGQCPGPAAGSSPRRADRFEGPGCVTGQAADQPRARGPRPPARTAPARPAASPRRPAVPAQRQRHRQIGDDLPRVVHRPAGPPPRQPHRQPGVQPGHLQCARQQHPAGLRDNPAPSAATMNRGRGRAVACMRKCLPGWCEQDSRRAPFSSSKALFSHKEPTSHRLFTKARG
jgi:hypothetical protein